MKFCSKCGKEIMDEAVFCPHCGCAVAQERKIDADDAPSTLFTVLGVFLPLVGFIIWLCLKDTSPQKAKSAGKGAIIGVCVNIGLSILWSVFVSVILGSIFGSIMLY
jgi:hypothetical protein